MIDGKIGPLLRLYHRKAHGLLKMVPWVSTREAGKELYTIQAGIRQQMPE